MEKFTIANSDSLLKAADFMHDAGFNNDDFKYDNASNVFSIKARQYKYKGRFIQRQTNTVIGECKLVLFAVKNCSVVERDKEGIETVGEDYFNLIKIKNTKSLIVITAFREIKLEIDNMEGKFEYCEL